MNKCKSSLNNSRAKEPHQLLSVADRAFRRLFVAFLSCFPTTGGTPFVLLCLSIPTLHSTCVFSMSTLLCPCGVLLDRLTDLTCIALTGLPQSKFTTFPLPCSHTLCKILCDGRMHSHSFYKVCSLSTDLFSVQCFIHYVPSTVHR